MMLSHKGFCNNRIWNNVVGKLWCCNESKINCAELLQYRCPKLKDEFLVYRETAVFKFCIIRFEWWRITLQIVVVVNLYENWCQSCNCPVEGYHRTSGGEYRLSKIPYYICSGKVLYRLWRTRRQKFKVVYTRQLHTLYFQYNRIFLVLVVLMVSGLQQMYRSMIATCKLSRCCSTNSRIFLVQIVLMACVVSGALL